MSQKKVYKSARGKEIDMIKLSKRNELVPAVGNAKVNARGDKLGPNGTIVKTRDQVINEKLGVNIPNQVNVRQPVPQPVQPTKPAGKDISDQDPEGNE
jgi:hypothetical protein